MRHRKMLRTLSMTRPYKVDVMPGDWLCHQEIHGGLNFPLDRPFQQNLRSWETKR